MPFINVNLDDSHESKPLPNGKYDLVITECVEVLTKAAQKPQYKITLQVEGHDNAPPVYHYQGLPSEGDEPSATAFKALLLKRFLKLFNIPYDSAGIDTEALAMEMVGARAKAELKLGEPNDSGMVYNQLVVPRLADEGTRSATGAARPPQRKTA